MALAASVVQDKYAIIKEREGQRLARYLRSLYGNEKFGFKWSYQQTSYTDGKDIFILYELQRPDCRTFSIEELRALRKWHSVHERGHLEYDVVSYYIDWVKEMSSRKFEDWADNEKYPDSWVAFYGNVMLDGRMENFVVIDHPNTKDYIEFGNYEWRFGTRGSHAGEDRVNDFREMFMSRVLAMTDIDDWDNEAAALVNSIQHLIEEGRFAETTQDVLAITDQIMKLTWPTLMEWMDLSGQSAEDFQFTDEHADSQWGDPSEVEENVKRVRRLIIVPALDGGSENQGAASGDSEEVGDSSEPADESDNSEEDKKPSTPDFSKILRQEEKAQAKDEQEAEKTLGPYVEREENVEIPRPKKEDLVAISDTVTITAFDEMNLNRYKQHVREVKPFIAPTSKAMSDLLQGVPDATRRNQRAGRVKANRVWRTDTLQDVNVFEKRQKGTPGKDARVMLLSDISGSTGSGFPGTNHLIIDEIRKAQVLMVEACEKANIPVASYGFTEDEDGNFIYPFKPFGRFTDVERAYIGGVSDRNGNRDTICLQWAIDEVARYPEDIRVLFMLSDGAPCFTEGENEDTMRNIVLQAEKRGIDVVCLYIGPQEQRYIDMVHYMYPGRAIIVTKNLARELSRHVKRIIRKRK